MSDRAWKLVSWLLLPCILWIGTGYLAYEPTKSVVHEARLVTREVKENVARQIKWHIKAAHDAARILKREAQERLEA